MQKKKENLLGKIVKKNYNNKLEEVLEHKNFSEHTKSLLLSMLYKIESAYPDYERVKRNVESKEEYIENIISIIQNQCSEIDVISPSSPRSEELGRRIFIIDEKRKSIKCYPVERKMLYAIAKLGKRELIVDKGKYDIIAKPLSDLINIGSNINTVEPLRDFNGYSWTTLSKEIESIEYNLIYQNLRILLGYQFLKDWVENREFIADYMVLFKRNLRSLYGERYEKIIEELIIKIAILLDMKFNEEERQNLKNAEAEIYDQLEIVEDKRAFSDNVSQRKRTINEKIKTIDTILNNSELLQQEYDRRNATLPYDKKIFNMRTLTEQMIREREKQFEKIERLNKLLLPKNFIKYKKELEDRKKYLELLEVENIDIEIRNIILQIQQVFLKCFEAKIKQARTKLDVTKLIYEFRYYYLLNYDFSRTISEVPELAKGLQQVMRALINRAKEEGIIGEFSKREEIENTIFKAILSLRTIKLEDIYVMAEKDKENEEIYMIIFDESEFEQKVILGNSNEITKKDLGIKLNKKVKVFY